jgi:hypothetical protein
MQAVGTPAKKHAALLASGLRWQISVGLHRVSPQAVLSELLTWQKVCAPDALLAGTHLTRLPYYLKLGISNLHTLTN